jgi:hypothetical protein
MADDLRVGRAFLEDREKTAGNAQSLGAFRLGSLAGRLPYGGGVTKAMRVEASARCGKPATAGAQKLLGAT